MADYTLFQRLKRLFSTDVIIRNVGGSQLKVADTNRLQSAGNLATNNLIDRYTKLFNSRVPVSGYAPGEATMIYRKEMFTDYEAMETDSIIASYLDIVADECLAGDTVIPLLDGSKTTLKELYDSRAKNFWLYGLDANNTFKPIQAEKVAYNGKKDVYAITLDDGTVLKCTSNHIWIQPDGTQIQTDKLTVGSSILALPTKISDTRNMPGYELIWDKNKFEYVHRIVARKTPDLLEQRSKYSNSDKIVLHHASFNKLNNNPDELQWLNWKEHNAIHAEFNKKLHSELKTNSELYSKYKTNHKIGIDHFWKNLDKEKYSKEQSDRLKKYYSTLTLDEIKEKYSHGGEKNGMFGKGFKVSEKNNGRYKLGYDRLDTIDLDRYIRILIQNPANNAFKYISKEFTLLKPEYRKINKFLCKKYNCKNLKQLINYLLVNEYSNFISEIKLYCKEHIERNIGKRIKFKEFCDTKGIHNGFGRRILSAAGYNNLNEVINSTNHRVINIQYIGKEDVYDIVNAGDNHIFAIETLDGSKLYTHNCTTKDEFGDTLTIRSNNPKIQRILQNLFYDILNVEFNLWPWVRNLVKYGDFYLHLKLMEKYGIIGVDPISSFQMIREETYDPENPDAVRFKWDPSSMGSRQFVSHTSKQEVYENYEIAHFRMLSDTNFLPYGKSILEPARKTWKQLTLMEDAMLIHRIMRAPEKRVFKIDVGNIPPHEVDTYMQKIINNTKKVPYQDPNTGDYNLKFNMQNMIEDFYIPVRGNESGTSIDTTKGLDYDGITDVEYLKNRMLAALRVPKAFLNYEEGLSGKATLAAEDIRFSRTIERIQRIVISELYKIAIIHLYIQGFEDAELLDFELSMTAPSTIYEKEKIELWQSKVNLAKDMMESGLASQDWIYKNVFNMTEDVYADEKAKVLDDAKYMFRREQIKSEGNDPVKTGKSFGTAHDIASLYKGDEGLPIGYDEKMPKKDVANVIKPKLGRPPEHTTYGSHDHPLGQDPIGAKAVSNAAKLSDSVQRITKGLKRKTVEILKETYSSKESEKKDTFDLLDEKNIIDSDDIK